MYSFSGNPTEAYWHSLSFPQLASSHGCLLYMGPYSGGGTRGSDLSSRAASGRESCAFHGWFAVTHDEACGGGCDPLNGTTPILVWHGWCPETDQNIGRAEWLGLHPFRKLRPIVSKHFVDGANNILTAIRDGASIPFPKRDRDMWSYFRECIEGLNLRRSCITRIKAHRDPALHGGLADLLPFTMILLMRRPRRL